MHKVVSGGMVDGGGVLVLGGLAAGDRVVTEGQFRLKTGIKVSPMAPGEVAAPTPVPAADGGKKRGGRG
jgi:multidrug efflux system membrane fusion protein